VERTLSARGERFAIATPHVAATEASLAAFEAGGNAVDAALAAAATLAVVYPHNCGVGGDLFALVNEPEGRTIAVNSSGAAPVGVDVEAVRRRHAAMPERGALTVTVPGAVAGWAMLAERWSRLGLAPALEPATRAARSGVPVAPSLAASLEEEATLLAADPGIAGIFFPGGRPLAEGATFAQPALAATLEAIAARGPSVVYGGDVGERLAQALRGAGSAMTVEDLAGHEAEVDSPLSARYRDLHVSVVPPNSQGFVLLEALRAIEQLAVDPDPLGPDAPTIAEVFASTAADRDRHNADPRFARVPVGTLLDEGHVSGLVEQVRDHDVGSPSRRRTGDTVALVAADAEGWAVSIVQSLYEAFGAAFLEPTTGVAFHDRGSAFSLDPHHPNVLAGGKRPAHTLMPVLVHRDGRLAAASGSRGGGAQPQINAASIIRAFDLGMDVGDVLDAPRWLVGGMELQGGRSVEAEARVPLGVVEALGRRGFDVRLLDAYDEDVGHAHLIRVAPDGAFEVATDPRADGAAAAL
jgi:gamma-glutamyltranspeptidase